MKLKEIEYKGFTIEVFYGDHMSNYFYCKAGHLSSKHNKHHINGGWETIDKAVTTTKEVIDDYLAIEINSTESFRNVIINSLEYDEEFSATLDVDVLQNLLNRLKK